MTLDRWIAFALLCICLTYGYTAWFVMDDSLAPFMKRNPIWPSTFPKVLSVLGIIACLAMLFGLEKVDPKQDDNENVEIDYRRLREYNFGQALFLLGLMAAYALCLYPLGFLVSTATFLVLGSYILGERKWHIMLPVSFVMTFIVWYLVQEVLDIYMRPLPIFWGG